jgi:hypothetical protein
MGAEKTWLRELRYATGFSMSIPFPIGNLPFIVFLGNDPLESG